MIVLVAQVFPPLTEESHEKLRSVVCSLSIFELDISPIQVPGSLDVDLVHITCPQQFHPILTSQIVKCLARLHPFHALNELSRLETFASCCE